MTWIILAIVLGTLAVICGVSAVRYPIEYDDGATQKSLQPMQWAATAMLGILAIVFALMGGTVGRPTAASAASDTGASPENQAIIADLLTVKDQKVRCLELVPIDAKQKVGTDTIYSYDIAAPFKKAVKGSHDSEHRTANDAISTPVLAGQKDAQITELQTAICRDPVLGATWAYFFAHLKVHDVNVADLNKGWLGQYKTITTAQINDKAADFVPLLGVAKNKVTAQLAQDARKDNVAYQKLAGYVGTLIDRFTLGPADSARSTVNYDLVSDVIADGLPEVQVNPRQEAQPARHLLFTVKGTCVADTDIGFNLRDKRPEIFGTPKCSTPSPQASASPSCKHSCGTTSPKGCTSKCGHSTPPAKCDCVSKTEAAQTPKPAPKATRSVPTHAPAPVTTAPKPIVTGKPTPVDTQTHAAPIPTPTGGPFG